VNRSWTAFENGRIRIAKFSRSALAAIGAWELEWNFNEAEIVISSTGLYIIWLGYVMHRKSVVLSDPAVPWPFAFTLPLSRSDQCTSQTVDRMARSCLDREYRARARAFESFDTLQSTFRNLQGKYARFNVQRAVNHRFIYE
jgi:hypothetical protein